MPDMIEYENGAFSTEELAKLKSLGHELKPVRYPYGDMQAALLNKSTKQLSAASDKRGEGRAVVGK
jgi:gamma-glutamyltranspeptidase/glutathione hydrolase